MQSSATVQYTDIDDLSANTAHGPALDGRSIPALVAPGCNVDSSNSATGFGLMCGTSMASPHVTGASALFVEYYRNLTGAQPSPALIKAAFTAVAKNLTGNHDADGNLLTHLFDSKQGWGRLLIDPVLAPAQAVQYVDQTQVFDNTGENWTHSYTAADPSQPIRIMLAWTDAPGHGLGGSTPAWNNDLDLRVDANGSSFLGNVLDDAGWSTTGGSADARNNTEAVFLQPAQHGGAVTIEVLASDINSDALPNSGDGTDQDFALVCYNCVDASAAVADVGVAATAPAYAVPGQPIRYDIDVANAGPGTATGVSAILSSADLGAMTPVAVRGWDCSPPATPLTCRLQAPLAAGATATLGVEAVVDADAADPLTMTVAVSADQADGNDADNTVVVSTPLLDRIFGDGFELPASP
jgi:hypothetical protein